MSRHRNRPFTSFHEGWREYEQGFGTFYSEYWLGFNWIRELIQSGESVLRVDLISTNGTYVHAVYEDFSISGSNERYSMNYEYVAERSTIGRCVFHVKQPMT